MYSKRSALPLNVRQPGKLLAIRVPSEIDDRLEALVQKTGRTKTYYVREAILRFLKDTEDTYSVRRRPEKPGRRRSTVKAKRKLGQETMPGK